MKKKVSIILPTYNGARYIRDSIHSCLEKQTYPNIELVIVDDCSTDETPQILSEYQNDSRIKVVRHEVNAKLPTALNTGFAHASGEYLTWTSDDNLFVPMAIEKMVEYLEQHTEVGFVYSDYWLIDEHGHIVRHVEGGPPDHLKEDCRVACFLYRRQVYEQVGDYDPSLFRIEDYDYWLRVMSQFKLGWHPEPLYYYRRHAKSLTGTDHLIERARRFDDLHTRYFGPDARRRQRVLSQFYIAEAFERHLVADRPGVLRYLSLAIPASPALLKNRGVWSILLHALVGSALMKWFRRLTRFLMPTATGLIGYIGIGQSLEIAI